MENYTNLWSYLHEFNKWLRKHKKRINKQKEITARNKLDYNDVIEVGESCDRYEIIKSSINNKNGIK